MADPAEIKVASVGKTACHQCGNVVDVSGAEPFSIVECPHCQARFAAPGQMGPFILLKALGKGEMGATYKGFEKGLGRYVAVKVMRASLGSDRRRVDGFLAEARALASLDHPNAVRVFSVGQEQGQPYIVMELITGRRLEQLFSGAKPMDEAKALEIALGVARALQAACEIGLIHGDVKPGNIMIDEKGRAKLVDFGIARFGGGQVGANDVLGTPYYAAPEQVRREMVDFRTDIYSLGATLYHALAGSPPFPGTVMKEVLEARLQAPAPDLLKVRPSLHRQTADVVARMLASRPDDRYGSYEQLLGDLEVALRATTHQEAPAAAAPSEPAGGISFAKPTASRAFGWILVGVAALVLAGLSVWGIWLRGGGQGPAGPNAPAAPAGITQVSLPVFSPPGRAIAAATDVTIACDTPQAEIHYTVDGGEPDESSPLCRSVVRVEPGMTLKARAFRTGLKPSRVMEALYPTDAAKLSDIVPLQLQANKAWDHVRQLDRPQGFAKLLDQCDTQYRTAEELYRQSAFDAAKPYYRKVIELCAELEERQRLRQSAAAVRDKADDATESLARADTGRHAREAQAQAVQAAKQAEEAFEAGEFARAEALWTTAESAAVEGQAEVIRRARTAWENATKGVDLEDLKANGGQAWQAVERALARARQAEDLRDAESAIQSYKSAAGLLPRAREFARSAQAKAAVLDLLDDARKFYEQGSYHQALDALKKVPAARRSDPKLQELTRAITSRLYVTIRTGNNWKLELVWIPAGKFTMGSPAEEKDHKSNETQHEVKLTKPFYLGKYEITRKQFEPYAKDRNTVAQQAGRAYTLYNRRWGRVKGVYWKQTGFEQKEDHPVVCVSWYDATEYCKWLSTSTGKKFRLPTEAEWEYACRAGTTTRFHFGDDDDQLSVSGNYADRSLDATRRDSEHNDTFAHTAPVGKFKPNAWDLHDMHGNAWEWCLDGPDDYPKEAVTDPVGSDKNKLRSLRGGSWRQPPAECRSAYRYWGVKEYPATTVGFRIVMEVE